MRGALEDGDMESKMNVHEDLIQSKTSAIIIAKSGEVNHRAWIIMWALDIEAALKNSIIKSSTLNIVDSDFVTKSELKDFYRIINFSSDHGIIGEKTKDDIHCFRKLRNAYAHDRNRAQLEEDPEMLSILKSTNLYKENYSKFDESDPIYGQRIMMAIARTLFDIIESGQIE